MIETLRIVKLARATQQDPAKRHRNRATATRHEARIHELEVGSQLEAMFSVPREEQDQRIIEATKKEKQAQVIENRSRVEHISRLEAEVIELKNGQDKKVQEANLYVQSRYQSVYRQ